MMVTKFLTMTLVIVGLTGCATAKPEMTDADYIKYAHSSAAFGYCIQRGWIDAPTAALGKRYLESNVNSYTVDYSRLNKEEALIIGNVKKPNQGECNQIAVTIHSRYQSIKENNQAVEYNNQQTQELINGTKIRNTYCNQFGTTTLCNTF